MVWGRGCGWRARGEGSGRRAWRSRPLGMGGMAICVCRLLGVDMHVPSLLSHCPRRPTPLVDTSETLAAPCPVPAITLPVIMPPNPCLRAVDDLLVDFLSPAPSQLAEARMAELLGAFSPRPSPRLAGMDDPALMGSAQTPSVPALAVGAPSSAGSAGTAALRPGDAAALPDPRAGYCAPSSSGDCREAAGRSSYHAPFLSCSTCVVTSSTLVDATAAAAR